MNWREWPQGVENAEYTGVMNDKCPVCSTTLRPVEVFYISHAYDDRQEDTIFYTTLCPKCRTQYQRNAPRSKVNISPDAEKIIELEIRVQVLEETLSRLITFIRGMRISTPTPQIPEQRSPSTSKDSEKEAEDFTRRYKHLL